MNFDRLCRAVLLVLLISTLSFSQQRPLLTEDPRLIPEGSVVTELGMGYQHLARFPVSGLTGDFYSILENGLHFGLGKRAEFQMTGVIHYYLSVDGGGSRNDWGDLVMSTKIKLVDEKGARPAISFRPSVVLPNSSRTKDIGFDGTHFFGNLLFGKTAGPAYVFGTVGLGVLDDPLRAASQHDFLTYGIAASFPVNTRLSILAELNGRHNFTEFPSAGGESRGQGRLGVQIKAGGMRWDAGFTAGTTHWEHKAGFVAGMSKEFQVWKP
ncbi:MAG TPA: hypothetical protein VFE29_05690 [Terriglobia bacterium]|nr:hypothetical protein [Terriglobia bacterium]